MSFLSLVQSILEGKGNQLSSGACAGRGKIMNEESCSLSFSFSFAFIRREFCKRVKPVHLYLSPPQICFLSEVASSFADLNVFSFAFFVLFFLEAILLFSSSSFFSSSAFCRHLVHHISFSLRATFVWCIDIFLSSFLLSEERQHRRGERILREKKIGRGLRFLTKRRPLLFSIPISSWERGCADSL